MAQTGAGGNEPLRLSGSVTRNGTGYVGLCDPLQKKSRCLVRHIEMQLQVGRLTRNFRRLSEKH
jgi:hypothetical protein